MAQDNETDIIDTIAAAARRRVRYPSDEAAQNNARAILSALRERYAIVELPEPDQDRYEGDEGPPEDRLAWLYGHGLYGVSVWHAGQVQVGYNNEPGEPLSLAESRRLAAALLAAADKAAEDRPG